MTDSTSDSTSSTPFRCGYIAIVGRPNVGKSTLLNQLLGEKVAIVTPKPQTTRNRIQGIVTKPQGQIVFIDTPGLHEADSALGRQMMQEVAAALEGIDVLLLMADASCMHPHADDLLLEKAKRFRGKTILEALRLHELSRDLQLAPIFVHRNASAHRYMQPVLRAKSQQLRRRTKHHDPNLSALFLEREIQMSRVRIAQV